MVTGARPGFDLRRRRSEPAVRSGGPAVVWPRASAWRLRETALRGDRSVPKNWKAPYDRTPRGRLFGRWCYRATAEPAEIASDSVVFSGVAESI